MTPTGSTYTRTYPRAAVLPHRVFSPRKPCQQIHTGKQAESCGGKPDPDSRRASRRKGGNILGKDAARKPLRKPPEPPIPDAASWPQLPLPPPPPFPGPLLSCSLCFWTGECAVLFGERSSPTFEFKGAVAGMATPRDELHCFYSRSPRRQSQSSSRCGVIFL